MTTPSSPYWARQVESWAVDQHRQHHSEALFMLGENTQFVLLWTIEDFEAGDVARCSVCYVAGGEIASAYGQTSDTLCATCYGTTYEGGIKQTIIRPALWDFTEEEGSEESRRGLLLNQSADVQSTPDVKMRRGDWVIRGDNSRFQIQSLRATDLRTGFAFPGNATSFIGGVAGRAVREATTSVAYLVPPTTDAAIAALLNRPTTEYQPSSTIED